MKFPFRHTFGAAFLFCLVFRADFAHAEFVVLESNAPGIAARDRLPNNALLNIPDGKFVRVTRDGKTYKIMGSHRGTVEDYLTKDCSWLSRLRGACVIPGENPRGETEGATRSTR
jgi:hypothetical protein